MIEFLGNWIINIVIFIIFIVITETMIPSDKYKKVIKLVTGLVLMIVIINPIVTLINKDYSLNDLAISSFNNFNKEEIINQADKLDNIQSSQVINIYEQELTSQIKEQILEIKGIKQADVNINIERNNKNKNYGSILGLDINVYVEEKSSTTTGIKEVNINIENNKSQDELVNNLKQKLSTTYEIPEKKINIKIQK